ncbi:hypothetical protein Dimus_023997 [Dionaea muscipula]
MAQRGDCGRSLVGVAGVLVAGGVLVKVAQLRNAGRRQHWSVDVGDIGWWNGVDDDLCEREL